jgi:uncharacterized protein with von Willebrand factor type A (vWA) domain
VDKLLANFIRALRNAEVRVSTVETLDAVRTVELVGYRERALLKTSLGLVLPKTQEDKITFDRCFDKFFSLNESGNVGIDRAIPKNDIDDDIGEDTNADDLTNDASLESGANQSSPGSNGDEDGGRQGGASSSNEETRTEAHSLPDANSKLGRLLMRGDRMEIGAAIAEAGEQVNVRNIKVFTQKGVYTRKVMNAMGLEELNSEIETLRAGEPSDHQRLARELSRRREWLRERVRDYVEHQFLLHADVTGKRLQEDLLRTVRLSNADQRSLRRMQEMVLKMGKRLASLYSRRRRVFRRGQLHVPRTIRSNLSYDGALFDLKWRSSKVDRPKVFAICDVSGSVANYAKFMLMLLYSLGEALPKVRSFAFSSELREVSSLFDKLDLETAIARIMLDYGGSTDYGQALMDFEAICLGEVDKRSTVLIIGDARSNNGELRRDILKAIYDRCKRLIWLNPEPRSLWNTGDSEIQAYSAYCHQVEECNSLAHLEQVASRLLRAAT